LFGNNFNVIFILFFYFFTIFFVNFLINKFKLKTKPLPKLKINKNGIFFTSYLNHKIKINFFKILIIDNVVYLKQNNNFILIKNVANVFTSNNYLYFKGLGEVKIMFNAEEFYRYFNIVIKCNKFNINKLKQNALMDILNNVFNLKNSKILKKYVNFIKNVLKININNKKISIKPNNFNFSYTLYYVVNNKIKQVEVKERIWQKHIFLI